MYITAMPHAPTATRARPGVKAVCQSERLLSGLRIPGVTLWWLLLKHEREYYGHLSHPRPQEPTFIFFILDLGSKSLAPTHARHDIQCGAWGCGVECR